MDITHEIWIRAGLAATHELLRAGATSRDLTRAVRMGTIIRVRQGWYGLPHAHAALEAAVRVGGRATCTTALEAHGIWSFRAAEVHVRAKPHDARLRRPYDHRRRHVAGDGAVVHWRRGGSGTRHLLVVADALADMIGCQSPERIVAAADCAIGLGHLSRARWRRIIASAPSDLRALLSRVDPTSGSIYESVLRFRLERRGFVLRTQVAISGVGRVDFLLGRRLVIEVDGWESHGTREAFEEDRRRDAELVRQGYRVLRFTARQIRRSWRRTLATIEDCVSQGFAA